MLLRDDLESFFFISAKCFARKRRAIFFSGLFFFLQWFCLFVACACDIEVGQSAWDKAWVFFFLHYYHLSSFFSLFFGLAYFAYSCGSSVGLYVAVRLRQKQNSYGFKIIKKQKKQPSAFWNQNIPVSFVIDRFSYRKIFRKQCGNCLVKKKTHKNKPHALIKSYFLPFCSWKQAHTKTVLNNLNIKGQLVRDTVGTS